MIKVTATKRPVPREGAARLHDGKRDLNSIYPGDVVDVPSTAYYQRRLAENSLKLVDDNPLPAIKG